MSDDMKLAIQHAKRQGGERYIVRIPGCLQVMKFRAYHHEYVPACIRLGDPITPPDAYVSSTGEVTFAR